jgi:isopentenyl-diphosphate delta-isomerase
VAQTLRVSQTNHRRKKEHLDIALNHDVAFKQVSTGLDEYQFVHQALPEIDLADVDTATTLFGRRLAAPLVVSSMVGGTAEAGRINRNLASAAQALGLAMGVGSQRCSIEDPKWAPTYQVRDVAPDVLLFANLGAIQLNYGYGLAECRRAVEMIDADALVLHLNPLQEALQPEGNTGFGGLLSRIAEVCRSLPVPVIVKEVGCGISEETTCRLAEAGVAGIDVAGAGGTSFSEVERFRSRTETARAAAAAFADWGIPTAESLRMARRGAPELTIIASGGIRTGVEVAKSIALGAHAAGMGTPLLKAANVSHDEAVLVLDRVITELRTAMFCIGTATVAELRDSPSLRKV